MVSVGLKLFVIGHLLYDKKMFELLKAMHEIQPALSINVVMTAMLETVAFEKVGNSFNDFQFSCGLLHSVLDIEFTPRTLPTNTILSMNIYIYSAYKICMSQIVRYYRD